MSAVVESVVAKPRRRAPKKALAVQASTEIAPVSDARALLQMIERAARDPSVDIEKMDRLLAMQERIVTKAAEADFNTGMSACQADMRPVAVDADNPQTHSKYASYAKLDRALRPIYTQHGFSISFDEADSPKAEHVRVLAYVAHRGGFTRTYHTDMPCDGKGPKGGDVMSKTHATAAARSYGMRYLLRGIFNIAVGEADNDGNEPVELITEKQVADLKALLTEVKADIPAFLRWIKAPSLSQIRASSYQTCVDMVQAKRRSMR